MRSTQSTELKPSSPTFTEQERRLLTLACRGLSNREIAKELALAESTVKKLFHLAFRKLGTSNRVQALSICVKQGVVNAPDIYPIESLINCLVPSVPEKTMLTHRERLMLALAAQGLDNREIAERMNISVGAVKMCLGNIFTKLGARSRLKAILLALSQGFLNDLEIMSPEDAVDMVAASGIRDTEIYLALLEQKLDALAPDELWYEPYISNFDKLKRFRDLLRERLTCLQGDTRTPPLVR